MIFTRYTFLFISCMLAWAGVSAYSDEKAILLVNRNLQKDSIGYNIADDLARVVYDAFRSGQLKLWDSPEKKQAVSPEVLSANEKDNEVSFLHPRNIFIYESWTLKHGRYKFSTKGISFTSQNNQGKDIFLGFAEMNTMLRSLFDSSLVNVNANGFYGTTLSQALQSRNFEYDLVFFDNEAIHNFKKGLKLKNTAMAARNTVFKNTIPLSKLVEYSIEPGLSGLTENSAKVISSLQKFFNDNPQEFYNYGGDKLYSYMRQIPVILSSITVTETWNKTTDSVKCTPVQYTPYAVGDALNPISPVQMELWHVRIDGKELNRYISQKNFYYRISRINATAIPAEEAENCKKKLMGKDWHAIFGQKEPDVTTSK